MKDSEFEWKKFKFFMLLECFLFVANLFAAIFFMIMRSMFQNQVSWDIEEDDKWELSDAMIMNGEAIDLF